MRTLVQSFKVEFNYDVHFTNDVFDRNNLTLKNAVSKDNKKEKVKLFFVVDDGVLNSHLELIEEIHSYVENHSETLTLCGDPLILPGGEKVKNNTSYVMDILEAVNRYGICRHSYIIAIGGGAILDLVGHAASIAHRGIRHIRIPTTVLSQNDSGIGVKNSINFFDKKNFLGCFAPPYAVINDFEFLTTLENRDWRSGISEAIKVALIKDAPFFDAIKSNVNRLNRREMPAMKELIHRCADLHLQHIAGGDPFEMGSSRPLDFGHWSAHKLEQISKYALRHGEAVAIGIAIDTIYSHLSGMLSEEDMEVILLVLSDLGFDLYVPELSHTTDKGESSIIAGLKEFREHLGGELTIMLLAGIGKGVEVHQMNPELILNAIALLEQRYNKATFLQAI